MTITYSEETWDSIIVKAIISVANNPGIADICFVFGMLSVILKQYETRHLRCQRGWGASQLQTREGIVRFCNRAIMRVTFFCFCSCSKMFIYGVVNDYLRQHILQRFGEYATCVG
jgi:hypothetical protein